MKLIELIKSKFKSKPIETSIIPFDTTKIEIPKYKELSDTEKLKVKEYQNELKIEDFSTLIRYPDEVRHKGDKLAKLLNELLYNLVKYIENLDIKKSLGRDIKIDSLEFVDYLIDTQKIKVLNQELNNLVLDTTLRIVAIREYIKKYKLINILKSKTNLSHLKNLENTMLIALMALFFEQKISNNIEFDSDSIQDNLIKLSKDANLIKNGSLRKLKYFLNINKYLLDNKIDLNKISCLINSLTKEKESEVIMKMAIIDIDISNYLNDNKDKLIDYYRRKLKNFENIIITNKSKYMYTSEINKLEFIKDIFKKELSDDEIKRLYKLKLKIDLLDINGINPFYFLRNDDKALIYQEIVREEVEQFLSLKANNKSDEARNRYLKRKILNKLEKINNDNVATRLKISSRLFKIIYMVNHPGLYQERFNVVIKDIFNFQTGHRFSVQEDLFYVYYNDDIFVDLNDALLTIDYTMLRDLEKLYLNNSIFQIDIEKIKIEFIALILILLNNKYNIDFFVSMNGDTLSIKEGVREIRSTDAVLSESDFLESYHKKIKKIRNIKHLELPNTLKVIGENTFYRFDLESILLPDSIEKIEEDAFNDETMEELRKDKVKVKK